MTWSCQAVGSRSVRSNDVQLNCGIAKLADLPGQARPSLCCGANSPSSSRIEYAAQRASRHASAPAGIRLAAPYSGAGKVSTNAGERDSVMRVTGFWNNAPDG